MYELKVFGFVFFKVNINKLNACFQIKFRAYGGGGGSRGVEVHSVSVTPVVCKSRGKKLNHMTIICLDTFTIIVVFDKMNQVYANFMIIVIQSSLHCASG